MTDRPNSQSVLSEQQDSRRIEEIFTELENAFPSSGNPAHHPHRSKPLGASAHLQPFPNVRAGLGGKGGGDGGAEADADR